jgi:RNA polymerase sigma-70 factor (ECF subfamily)
MSRRAAFEQAVSPHLAAAWNLARWLLRDTHDAEDVLQESIARALAHFDGFRGTSARPWLLAIVRNTCFRMLESRGRAPAPLEEEAHAVIDLPQRDPERQLLRSVEAREINDAVAALLPEFREVFILRELEGLSYKEIAEVAGIPLGTVMSRLSRARADLQRRLAHERPKEQAR